MMPLRFQEMCWLLGHCPRSPSWEEGRGLVAPPPPILPLLSAGLTSLQLLPTGLSVVLCHIYTTRCGCIQQSAYSEARFYSGKAVRHIMLHSPPPPQHTHIVNMYCWYFNLPPVHTRSIHTSRLTMYILQG